MNAQQLKNAILQEAIEGRLVPQDPNDEPVSALLDRIRKEKVQLLKEGKLKKKDLEETPITEDEKPFEIPESWEWVRLGDISTYSNSKKKINATRANPQKWSLDLEDIEKGGNLLCIKSVEERKAIGDKTCFNSGDILYSKLRPYLLKILIAPQDGICTPEIIPFTCYGKISRRYIVNVLKSPYVDDYINSATYGVKMPRVSTETMTTLLIPLPPLAEQQRIVARIEELLPKVEEYGKAQEALDKLNAELPERLKKSILQEAIEGRLVPQDPNDEPASALLDRIRKEKAQLVKAGKLKKKDLEETPISEDDIPFDIPDSWEWVRISDVVNVLMGQSPDGNDVFEAKEGDKAYEFHQGKICFTEKYITQSGKWCNFPSRIANKDSLLICVRAPIGDVNITQRSIGIGRGLAAMEGMGNISNMFLFYWMLAHKRCLEDQGTGSTFKAITVEVLKNQKIPLPPLAEQKRIVAKIEEAFKAIDALS